MFLSASEKTDETMNGRMTVLILLLAASVGGVASTVTHVCPVTSPVSSTDCSFLTSERMTKASRRTDSICDCAIPMANRTTTLSNSSRENFHGKLWLVNSHACAADLTDSMDDDGTPDVSADYNMASAQPAVLDLTPACNPNVFVISTIHLWFQERGPPPSPLCDEASSRGGPFFISIN